MEPLNITAVLAGTALSFVAGWAYYSPKALGRSWATGSGISPEPPATLPWAAMALQLIGLFLLALVVGLTAQSNALFTAIFAILAAAGMVMAQDAFSQKSGTATLIDGGYVVLAGVLMILCQGLL
ncbi:DUF1761 domain-containing protein [Cognatishimia sp. SS12]|uniref:DUF1761 domain-containing protein n=1 Tax=Cognatishimia sp. SS12 TaxID=2979465 RepID=UPI00232C1BB2|nr:DUF1761 domain-containing protein [Cognatishimia sp. SS12]MDC0737392.1 DUF1761 domain-containing protein [Cognatishimia sp. SS12]